MFAKLRNDDRLGAVINSFVKDDKQYITVDFGNGVQLTALKTYFEYITMGKNNE